MKSPRARRTFRSALAILAFGAAVASPRAARADEQAELDKARNAYLAKQYDEAEDRFRALLDPKTGTVHEPTLVSQAYMYWGAVLLAKGQKAEAEQIFEQLLLKDPHFEPDPLSFPTAVVDAFIDARTKIRDRLNAEATKAARDEATRVENARLEGIRQGRYIQALEAAASAEPIVNRRLRIVAFTPFGAGQFQNGDTALGYAFLGTESAFLVAGVVTVPLYLAALSRASADYDPAIHNFATRDGQDALDAARAYRVANLAFYGALAATAIAGVVHANLRYVPEVTTIQTRPLPPHEPKITVGPTAVPVETPERGTTGGIVGIVGRF